MGAESDFMDMKPAHAVPRRRVSSRNLNATSDAPELQPEPGAHPLGAMAEMQRLAGNRAVSDLIGGGGAPIQQPERSGWEESFGRDFGDVRIHSGPAAGDVAHRAGAVALTVGSDIVLDSQVPDLTSGVGREVLGEELAHVAQGVGTGPVTSFTDPHGPIEQEAGRAGTAAAAGERVHVGPQAAGPSVVGRRLVLFPYPHMEEEEAPEGGGSPEDGWATRQKRALSRPQQGRLTVGAIVPIKRTMSLIGTKDPNELRASLAGVPDLISGITVADPENQGTLIEAYNATTRGMNALYSAANPEGALIAAARQLTMVAAILDGVVSSGNQTAAAPKPAETPGAAPAGSPGGPAGPGESPAGPAGPAVPSPGEIEQVKGIRAGVGFVQAELAKPVPDFSLAQDRIGELATTAQSYGDSPALAGPLGKAGRNLEGVNDLILGARGGVELSLDLARGRLGTAVGLLAGLAGVAGLEGDQPAGAEGPGGS